MANEIVRKGVIDSLSAGFGLVIHHPWIILIPLLADSFLLTAPHLISEPLDKYLVSGLQSLMDQAAIHPDRVEAMQSQVENLGATVGTINILGILGWQLPNFIGIGVSFGFNESRTILHTWSQFFVVSILIAAIGIFLGCLFFGSLAQLVRDNKFNPSVLLYELRSLCPRFTLYIVLLFLLTLLIGVCAAGLLGWASLLAPAAGNIVIGLFAILILPLAILIGLYLFLAEEAIFLGGVGPRQAVKDSFNIARKNFGSTLLLFALVFIIIQGLGLIWKTLAGNILGLLFAVLGNAFIGTSLAAAVMVYYWDRRPDQGRI